MKTRLHARALATFLCGWLWVFAGTNCFPAQLYSVTDLGILSDLSGRTDAKPNGINATGSVAGANTISGAYRAVLYTGTWTNLGTLGGTESEGTAVNDACQVAGYAKTGTGATHAFIWTPGGRGGVAGNPQMSDLGTLGGSSSAASGINRSGQATGYSDIPAGQQRAFLYSGGSMIDIGRLLSSLPNSFGYGINSSGHIAGTAYDSKYHQSHAFFYNGATAVDIGSLGGQNAEALAINDGDHIAGYSDISGSETHAFHYYGGAMTDLGTLGGGYSYGIGINNSNAIVGGSFVDAQNTIYHAFVWTTNSMIDLNSVLDASGSGWTLVEARAINDAGRIAGTGTYAGSNRMFLLTPKPAVVPAPRVTAVTLSGSDVVISFTTVSAASYTLQTNASLFTAFWSNSVTGISGTGGAVSVTNTRPAALARCFYRVQATSR